MHSRKKSSSKRLGLRFCLLFLIILLVILGIFVYKIVSGLKNPIDLGIVSEYKDYEEFISEVGIELGSDDYSLCFTCPVKYEGSHKAIVNLSNEEASAWFDAVNTEVRLIKDTQIKFEEDKVSISTNFMYQGQDFPVFVSGDVFKSFKNTVSIDLYEAKLGTVPVPKQYVEKLDDLLTEFTNKKLGEIDSFRIDKLEVRGGFLEFEGIVPDKATGM